MSAPGTGEKVCPFCAETIKAAAVKCRFCQSDLPEPEEAELALEHVLARQPLIDLDLDEPEPEPDAAPAVAPEPSRGPGRTIGMLVLCVILGAGITWLLVDDRDPEPAPPPRPAAAASVPGVGSGTSLADPAAVEALRAAAANATSVLSYSYKTLAKDQAGARAVMTPEFAAEYDNVMKDAAVKARDSRLSLRATVVGSSLVTLGADRVVALLFVNAATTSGDSPKAQVNENRVLMTMTRQDGAWIVSQIEAF